MKITIFGVGYVGLVTGACLADMGHEVLCMDVDPSKIARLQRGECLIYEPGLSELLHDNLQNGRLHFTTDIAVAVNHATCLMITVGTLSKENGAADLQHVVEVVQQIALHMCEYKIVITKSTVPVGTSDLVRSILTKGLVQRGAELSFSLVANPEFLQEGIAIHNFMQPNRIVLGIDQEKTRAYLLELYRPLHDKLLFVDLVSAELSKYAANAMLATRISFMNELAQIATKAGADIETVREVMAADPRIGPYFLRAGCGYGGSCLPKDVRALVYTAEKFNLPARLLRAVEQVNATQKETLFSLLKSHFGTQLATQVVAIWGLAFKPNTDDIREASSRVLIESLWQEGVKQIRVYDPVAMPAFADLYGPRADLVLTENLYAAVQQADVLVIVTEWEEFKSADWQRVLPLLQKPIIIDGRNLYDLTVMQQLPIIYYSIGRPTVWNI